MSNTFARRRAALVTRGTRRTVRLCAYAFMVVLALSITTSVESNLSLARQLDRLLVLPSIVSDVAWQRSSNALIQELGQDALYQNFNRENSAYLLGVRKELPQVPAESDILENAQDATLEDGDAIPTSSISDLDSGAEEAAAAPISGDAAPVETQFDIDQGTENATSNDQTSEEIEVEQSAPSIESEASASDASTDTPLEAMSKGFFRFVTRATSLLPFAQQDVVEVVNTEPESSEQEVSVDESSESETVVDESMELGAATDESDNSEIVLPDVTAVPDVSPQEEAAVNDSGVNETGENTSRDTTSSGTNSESNVAGESQTEADDEADDAIDNAIVFSGFGLPPLGPGQFIRNVQVRMSLGGTLKETPERLPFLTVEYTTGNGWQNAGSVVLGTEFSNALNGGYYLSALPTFKSVDDLANLSLRISYNGDRSVLEELFVDALWLEVDTETFTREMLNQRLRPEFFSSFKLPDMYEYIGTRVDFAREEEPVFTLRYESQRNPVVGFFRDIFGQELITMEEVSFIEPSGEVAPIDPMITVTEEGLVTIQLTDEDTERMQPGKYSVEITVSEGSKEYTDTFEFQWGVLAINTDQSSYALGDTATIFMGALSEDGNTLCEAQLQLYVFDPSDYIFDVPIVQSGLCDGNNVTDRADYSGTFVPTIPGTYEMYLEHIGADGSVVAHTYDTFIVEEVDMVLIRRDGPTRINPKYAYPMELTVLSADAFEGTLIERVPLNFTIIDTDARVEQVGSMWELSWDVSLSASSSESFAYTFDAPDISPYLYTVGPAELVVDISGAVISEEPPTEEEPLLNESITTEIGTEEVAGVAEQNSEAVTQTNEDVSNEGSLGTPEDVGAVDSEVYADDVVADDVVSETSQETESPATDAGTQSEVASEETGFFGSLIDTLFGDSEQSTPSPNPESGSAAEPGILETIFDTILGTGEEIESDPVADPTVSTSTDAFPEAEEVVPLRSLTLPFKEHREWQIASDATGNMLLYWDGTNIPAGWTCVSCAPGDVFYQRFIMGSSSAGISGGASTHTHTATGVVTASAASTPINSGGGGATNVPSVGHGHTYTPVIGAESNVPAYRELAVIQFNSAGSPPTLPTGAIAIFDAAVPIGWTRYAAQDGRYVRGASTSTAGTTGGSNTHSHIISGTLNATTNFITATAGDNLVNTASAGHTHSVSSATGNDSHEPPFREAVLGILSATTTPTDAMIAMWTDDAPPGWGSLSGPSDPFENRFVKASTTYGGVGGAATSTHANVTGIVSSGPSGTQTRDLVTVDNNATTDTHTHLVDVINFSVANTLPPFRTAVFAKRNVGGQIPDAPITHVLFNYEQTGTSTPSFEFTANDPDGVDTLVYQFQWDDDEDVETSPLGDRASDNESGCTPNCFSNTVTLPDTNPFNENERVRFTIQSSLSSGTTYYWRVRAKETVGNIWSEWSEVRSFTYQAGINPSRWLQTEGAQFDNGTLTNIGTTTGSALLATTSASVPTVVNNWTTATTLAATTLTLTKPEGVEVGDLLLIFVGNDDDTATAQWDNATLKPSGFTLINTAGNATPDAHAAAFYRVADGTESATTSVPAQSADDYWGYYIRVTGASTTNPINIVGADYAVNTLASHPVTGITTTINNTLAFYLLSADGGDNFPFSVSGTGWSESAETRAGTLDTNAAGAWGTRAMVAAGATGAATVGMSTTDGASGFQFAINPGYAQGNLMSPEISFSSVVGQSDWGVVTWSTTEPAGTDTRLRVYHSSSTACDTIIPDAALPGNSLGFQATGVELFINTLSTTTYDQLCLRMSFDVGTSTVSPELTAWSVDWAVPNQVPYRPTLALTPAFNNIRATTTRPTFGGFAATDFEGDTMQFELIVSTSTDLSSPVFVKQSSNFPTDAGWSAATFAAGATTTYTVQAGDALTPGTIYWWGVRARDPLGTNTWSPTSTPQSLSISTFIATPEWHQTSNEQFNLSVLSNATTSGGGARIETIGSPSTVITTQADWLQQYAGTAYPAGTVNASYTISAGTDRVLVVAVASTRTTVGTQSVTASYGGQPMTLAVGDGANATNRNHTYIFYLNDAGIAAASGDDLDVTVTGGTSYYTYVYAAVFAGVDQSTVFTDARNVFSGATANTAVGPFSAGLNMNAGDQAIEVINLARSTAGAPARTVTAWSNGTWPNPSSVVATYSPGSNWGLGLHINNRSTTTAATEPSQHTASAAGTHESMSGISLKVAGTGSQGTVLSREIDHDSVPGQSAWGEVAWTVTEPAGSETLLRLYYSSSTACDTIVPDGALPGNATGFSEAESPLDISSLSTTTYNRICLQMELQQDSAPSSPSINEWTVRWVRAPQFTQQDYRWYTNTATITPSDPWPSGGVDLNENDPIDSSISVLNNDVLRLRMSLLSTTTSAAANSSLFKLQYAEGLSCNAELTWNDVGDMSSTTALWRGFGNDIAADDWYDEDWSGRVKITIDNAQVPQSVTDFPVYIDLSNMPTDFFDQVQGDGDDIRVTTADGLSEVPYELVFISTSTSRGELHFKGNLSSTTDTEFYIYYGNPAASGYAANATYGRENVWTNGYEAVYHLQTSPASNMADSTRFGRTLTTNGGMTAAQSTSSVLGQGVIFDGNDRLTNTSWSWLNATNTVTVTAWNNVTTAETQASNIFAFNVSGSERLASHAPWNSPVNIYWDFGTCCGVGGRLDTSYTAYRNKWTHIGLVSRGATTTGFMGIYLDGASIASSTSSDDPNVTLTGFSLGSSLTTGGTHHRGRIDEFRIASVERSAGWIQTEYNNQSSPSTFYTAVAESIGAYADGTTLPQLLLTDSDVLGSYEEENPTVPNPNAINVGDSAEWDFTLQNNNATPGTRYCFRMVNGDGSALEAYARFPELITNASPDVESLFAPFDNEKVASTSPWFEFVAFDENGNEVDYQIQIDNDYSFSSTVIDTNSETNLVDFVNISQPSDKSPFNNFARMRYTIPSALTDGVTYYWRVRSKDANGSGVYGAWSTVQSFTVDTSVSIATWFQTTEEQFDTNAHEGTEPTGADTVAFSFGSTVGTTTSTAIDFADATSGNVWGELSFNETGAANDILYRIEYEVDGDWLLVPDSALPGNAAGFDTSPVDLGTVDVAIYDVIRIRANFNNGAPTIQDWTVSWGESVAVPTQVRPFDNEKFATTSPTFRFLSTDPESNDIEYEISWSTDPTFATGSTTRNSSTTPAGFVNLTNGGDTNPFTSGNTIAYTIQPGDVLTASTTYYWRTRAKDPGGSNLFSFWSDSWSFTTATSGEPIPVSTWYQTLGPQFAKGSLVGAIASTTRVEIGGGIIVESGWTSNTAVPGSSLTLTKPSGIESGDLLLILVGSDDDTATAQWNNTALKPSGFTLINTAGDATSDAHVAAFYRVANGSEGATINVPAQSSDDYWGYYIRVTGASTTNPINVAGADYISAGATSHAVTGITTTEDQTLAFYVLGGDGGDTFPFSVSGTGWVERAEIQAGAGAANAAGAWGIRTMPTAGATGDATVAMNVNDGAAAFQFAINPAPATSGLIRSQGIDFNDGTGPGWGSVIWNDTEPGASQVRYQVEFLNTLGAWVLIPDSALPGNAAGFTTAPIDLETLNTTTYNEIRIVGNLNCSGANCPILNDWTVTWLEGFSVSGTAVEYDGVASTTSGTVAVAVNGTLLPVTGTIQSNGTWTIDNVPLFSGDTITVFVSGAPDGDEAVAVSRFDGTPDVTGMRLQKRHLTIGSNDFQNASNTNLGLYDFSNDEDIFFDVNGSNDLQMCADVGCADAGIVILSRNIYEPGTGADVNTHDFRNNGTFTAGNNTIRVSGSWSNIATTTMTGSTVIFTATSSTESVSDTGSSTSGFNAVTFGETSGTATWTLPVTLDVNGILTVNHGTLARGTSSILVAGNLTIGGNGFFTGIGTTTFDGSTPGTWTDNNAVKQNIGNVVIDGTSKAVVLGSNVLMESLVIGANDTFDASISGHTASLFGNWINNNSFIPRTGTVTFIATTTNRIISASSSPFFNLTFAGAGGAWSFTNPLLTVTNNFSIATGTVTMPSGTTTIGASFLNTGGTFAHNNGTVVMNSSAGGRSISQSGTAFLNAFFNLTFTGSGSWAFTESAATTSNAIRIQSGTVTFPSGTLTVGGDLSVTGTGAFAHNNGEVILLIQRGDVLRTNGSSLNNLRTRGTGAVWYGAGWSTRKAITVNAAQVGTNVTDFPVYVNLSNLGSDFFSTVKADGGDIRVTTSDGLTEVPIEVVSIDTGSQTGELHFRAPSLSTTTNSTFYVYYGNSGASLYASTTAFGSQNVWSNGYEAVYHLGTNPASQIIDSTRNGRNLTSSGGMGAGNSVAGVLGNAVNFVRVSSQQLSNAGFSWPNASNTVTVTAWNNVASAVDSNLFGFTISAGQRLQAHAPWGDSTIYWDFGNPTPPGRVQTSYTTSLNKWTHIGLVSTGSGVGGQVIYLDGVSAVSGTASNPSATLTGFFLGSAGGSQYHNGRIDEFRIASVARSAGWIGTEENNQASTTAFYSVSGAESRIVRTFTDTNATILGNFTLENGGEAVLPTGTLSIGGSLDNNASFNSNNGTVRFNSTAGAETIAAGTSTFATLEFNSASGDFTVIENATATVAINLTNVSQFTVSSGVTLASAGTFTHAANGNNTTWTGSTLSLSGTDSSLNSKTHGGDVYGTLQVVGDTDISMWNSSSTAYNTLNTGSIYSQDHSGVDGDLYIFGDYVRTTGTEHWSFATDFDGTALGGGSRQVDVRLASGTVATIAGANFSIIGTTTGTTTIANQGSGTYRVVASSTATTFNFYDFSNLGTTGVTMRGNGTVSSLNNGAIKPGINAGTGFTISSTTINANPAFQIYNVDFSTTTLISATNVSQTDGTPSSYWWFRESNGNIDGEAFDADTGNPGSIRWDDSLITINISGVVYSDNGVTPMTSPVCDGVTQNIRVVIQGGASSTTSCNASTGAYTLSAVGFTGAPVLAVYLDTNGGARGGVITKTPTVDISNLHIYQNRIITRHEDVAPLTIADMAVFDADNDSDLRFTAATGTTPVLTLLGGTELRVASSTTFAPGGNITLYGNASSSVADGSLYIDRNATFTGNATSTYSIAGSFTMDTGATFTSASTSVVMIATTTGKTITTSTGQEIPFYDLSFTGIGGGWNINGNIRSGNGIAVATGTVSGTGNINITNGSFSGNGTVSLGAGTTTIATTNTLGGTTPWTFANLVLGNGLVTGTTTPAVVGTTTVLGRLTISTGHTFNIGTSLLDLRGSGTVFVENGVFAEGASTVRYSGTTGSNILSTTYHNLEVAALGGSPTYGTTGLGIIVSNNLIVGSGATTTFTLDAGDPALDVNGSVTINPLGTLVGSGSANFTVAGNWNNDGTFAGSNGTVRFDGGASTFIDAGVSAFSNVILDGAGAFTVGTHATATGAFTLTNVGSFTVSSGQILSVGGVFTNSLADGQTTWTGSTLSLYGGGNYSLNASTTRDVYATLAVASSTQVRMWNSEASTYAVDATGSLYSQDHANVTGDLYIYGAYTRSSGTDHWSYERDFDGTVISGSPRPVSVRILGGGSVRYLGGGLSVIGSSTATTTIENQGSGTYAFQVGGTASTTWSNFAMRDTDAAGLVLSGTPTVVNMASGDFEVDQNGWSALTVGGSVITQNPAKTFNNFRFATSTGISSAFNVTATGTTVSSWRFTNHSGSIDGEAFDSDPTGDPGYVVWDDSAALITVSGNIYSDEGVTASSVCDGSTPNVHLRVAGLTTFTTNCAAGTGAYSISGVAYGPADSLIVYIDGETERGATVTVDPISNISNMHVYENRVIVRHENSDPVTIADMAVWDSSDDADIPFTAVDSGSDTLTLPADRKLIVWTSKEFEPQGNVTVTGGGGGAAFDGTLELLTSATFEAGAGEMHTIGGSLILGTSATLDDDTSTFTFTTPGAGRTIDTNDQSFFNLTMNGSGSWNVTNTTLTIDNDFTITQGAITLPSATTTIGGSLLNTGGAFTSSGGTMVFTSATAETIRPRNSSFGTLLINGAGSFSLQGGFATTTGDVRIQNGSFTSATGTLAIGGNFLNSGTFAHASGILRFSSNAATMISASSSDLHSVTFVGTGPYTFTNASLALLGTLRIENGSVALPTTTLAIGGSFLNTGGSFTTATGTILFNSTDTGESINPGSSTFHNVSFGSATGGWTITNNATTTGNFSLTNAGSFTLASSTRLHVDGVFTNLVGGAATTWTGSTLRIHSGSGYTINTKSAGGDVYNNLIISSSTALRAWDSNATTTIGDSQSSFYSQDHAGVAGNLNIFGNYVRSAGVDYWSYATDFDGAVLGGGSRQAVVRIASGATTTFTGGTLQIIGAPGFDTTINNQGSGTYSVRMLGGTLNASRYAFSNMNASGLVLSGTTTVSSLNNGSFTLAVGGGSLISLASSTLNYNAGLVISDVVFATTTAITGFNVSLTGTTTNAWTFTGHTGNLAGEAFDSDGATACGSIRWSNSVCLLTQQSGYRFRADDGGEGVPDSEWFDLDWTKRTRVVATNADAVSYTDATIGFTVPYDADMQADFDDLRFTSADGVTPIDHFVESFTASTEAYVWVKVPFLATSTNTSIYMYYGNGVVTDGSASSTFRFIDSFEDGSLSEYGGDTSLFTAGTGFPYERTRGLDADGNESAKTTDGIFRTDVTVSQGEKIRYFQYIDTTAGSGDETCALFGVQSPGTANDNYAVCLELFGVDRVSIARDVDSNDTSGTILASTTITYVTGWHEVEIDWGLDNRIGVTVSRNNTVVASTSVVSSTYTQGGIGFTFWFQNGGWDIYTSRLRLATEPTVTFGAEQVPGGASWLAPVNTSYSGVETGDPLRVRFLVENTGLPIVDKNYEIEYAPKGASPSCEAVSASSFAPVPPQATCAGSPLCMLASSQITNLEATTDLLGGNGVFATGQLVEDPDNTTGDIDIASNRFTEVEYVITTTIDASAPSYCLRVSDEGVDLDAYARVAELGLTFEPTILSLSLNGEDDIALVAGATTTIYATGTVSDLNGFSDLADATTTIYRSGVGETCALDNNNCYRAGPTQCNYSNCSGNTCDLSCSVDIFYHAEPTDVGVYAGETWRAFLSLSDTSGAIATATAPSIDLLTLRAIDVDNTINYGALEPASDTGSFNATTTIENLGNDSIDLSLEGTDLTDGISSQIPVSSQRFATSTFTYSSCVYCGTLSTTPTNFVVDLVKPTSTSPVITDDLFWGIAVPFGVAGNPHSGSNLFVPIDDL